MKLHWVKLENWRQHAKTRIDFDEKTTVVYGPNETGKSTVLEALSRGFFDKSSTHAEAIKRIKPLTASGAVTSTVCIEFTVNKTRYRVEKNFNLRNGTSLHKIVGDKAILLNHDDSADRQLIELLEADLPSARGSKPSQWGAFRWLWAPQENRELPTDREGDPTVALHLETKDGAGLLVTPKFRAVQLRVETENARYFTRTGRTSKDSPISSTGDEIQTLQQETVELRDEIGRVDAEKQRLEDLQRQLPGLEAKVIETKEELKKARSEASDFSSVESELKAAEAAVREAARNVEDTRKAVTELEKSAQKIEGLQRKEKETREKLSRFEALCERLDEQRQDIKAKVEDKAEKIRACEELTRDARILWTRSDAEARIGVLEKKMKRVRLLDEKIERMREKEVPIVPTGKEIENLIQNQTRVEALKESLTARGLAINVAPGGKGSLKVEVDGERLKDGRVTATGTERVSVGAPGLGKVTIKATLEQAHDAKIDIVHLEAVIQGTLKKYAVNSIAELKKLNRTQKEVSDSIKELAAERRGVDERSIDEMTLDLGRLKERYEESRKIERAPNAIELNPTGVDLGKLVNKREKEEREARAILDKARAQRDEIDKELIDKKEELAEIRAEQKHLSKDLDDARIQEREIIRQYGSVEFQEKKLVDAEGSLDKRNKYWEEVKERYRELEKGPIYRMKRLEQQLENQEQVIQQQRTSIDQLKGGIGVACLGGAYSDLAEKESRIEIISERLEKEYIHAESYKLLKETLEQQYRSALSAVVGPIQEEVKRSLSYITGFLHEDVELNEYLFPVRLGERGLEDISLEFNDGSSGLKEVLALCVRVAVANHLAERDSQCLVLDDPFVHVSSDRSNKMIELLNEAIKEYGLQVIVFTHRQMEFAGFTGRMVDIQSVK